MRHYLEFGYRALPMLDVTEPNHVAIEVTADGRVWVNVEGVCVLRCCRSKQIILNTVGMEGTTHED